jgi:PIN domain nuclease of toxin-antitoxin system
LKGVLLDTSTLLWLELDTARIKASARRTLMDTALYLSVVSIAEIAIKAALGKLPLPAPFQTDFEAAVQTMLDKSAIDLLPLGLSVVARLRHLPQYHKDPFDRMIIAQALELGLAVATRDGAFSAYAGLDILEV